VFQVNAPDIPGGNPIAADPLADPELAAVEEEKDQKDGDEDEAKPEEIVVEIVANELPSAAQPATDADLPAPINIDFRSVFLSVFIYYHRVTTMFVRHKNQPNRPVQVLSTCCQMFIASASLSFFYGLENQAFHMKSHSAPIALVMIEMRFI